MEFLRIEPMTNKRPEISTQVDIYALFLNQRRG